MRRILRLLAVAAATAVTAVPVALATSSPASAAVTRCEYRVVTLDAPVRENPDTNSIIRTTKHFGDLVTSKHSCGYTVLDPESGTRWVSVNTLSASDGEGWIRADRLATA